MRRLRNWHSSQTDIGSVKSSNSSDKPPWNMRFCSNGNRALSQNIPSTKCIQRNGKNIASQDWKLRWISFHYNILFTNFFSKLKIEEFQDFLSSLAKSICVYFGSTCGHLQLYSINECTIKSNGNFFSKIREHWLFDEGEISWYI